MNQKPLFTGSGWKIREEAEYERSDYNPHLSGDFKHN